MVSICFRLSFNYTRVRVILRNVRAHIRVSLSTVLDDVSNVIAAATAVYQDSLALLISIYNRASILTCRNDDRPSHDAPR